MDIQLSPLENIVEVRSTKHGGHVVIGISREVLDDFMRGKSMYGGLVLINATQYDSIMEGNNENSD